MLLCQSDCPQLCQCFQMHGLAISLRMKPDPSRQHKNQSDAGTLQHWNITGPPFALGMPMNVAASHSLCICDGQSQDVSPMMMVVPTHVKSSR